MSLLKASPRSSPVLPTPPISLGQEGASHCSMATDNNKTNSTSPRHSRHTVQHTTNIPPSPQGYSNSSRSIRSNIHDILSADTQSSSHRSPPKRPYSTIVDHPSSLSQQPSKRSRENSPSRHYQGAVRSHQQAPAYALAGSGHTNLSAAPQLLNPSTTDGRGQLRKLSSENSPEEGLGSVSGGSAEPDSSPSSSHQDRERGYGTNPLASGHQQTTQERPAKKRNFANRTKTGCMTCRERKKKCDEGKPLCKNCERGGFKCKGYMQAGTTFRRSGYSMDQQAAVGPAPSVEVDTSPYSAQQALPHQHQDQLYPSTSRNEEEGRYMSRGEPTYEGRHSRTISTTESAPGYAQLQNQTSTPAMLRYDPGHQRYGQTPNEAPPQSISRPLDPPTRYAPHDQAHAGIAYAHKESMLRGWPFDRNDHLLQAERSECKRIIERFNMSSDLSAPHDGLWRQNAIAIFEPARRRPSIVSLPPPPPPRQHSASNPATHTFPEIGSPPMYPGYLGENVNIEKGFDCDYGYNIRIGQDVDIRANCYIEDAAVVDIGAGTSIGRDVMILTCDPEPYIPGRRLLNRSRGVFIGEGCHIGARVVIMPGTHIPPGTRVTSRSVAPELPAMVAAPPSGIDMRMAGR